VEIGPGTTGIVIGGGGAIGRGTALGLASRGANAVVADIEIYSATRVAEELESLGAAAIPVRVDATDRTSLAELADAAEARFGSIALLSNNVGVVQAASLLEATEEEWGWNIEFNLMSIVRACSVIVPRIQAHGCGGHVINTASMAALWAARPEEVSGVQLGLYTTTKHAVLGYTETLRNDLAAENIGVSCLCPGTVESNLSATSLRNRPARFGGPAEAPDSQGRVPFAMAQEAVTKYVLAAIEGNRNIALTHPGARPLVERRAKALAADFDFFDAIAAEEGNA
jgi:NAD(P)-dependent dehydrogenase (short-subunit alcohol dehydrogenase family)